MDAPRDEPRRNLANDPYFSDGMRLVVMLAPQPVGPSEFRGLFLQ